MTELPRPDERELSWKVLMPHEPGGRICVVGLRDGLLAGLARSHAKVDTILVTGQQYDAVVVCNRANRNAYAWHEIVTQVKRGGIVVNVGQARAKEWLARFGFAYSRQYAALPPSRPRVFVPLLSRQTCSKGLIFHSPGSLRARIALRGAMALNLLGLRRYLTTRAVGIYARTQKGIHSKSLIQWLSRELGYPIIDLVVYTGSIARRRKITALAIAEEGNDDVVVKIADTDLGVDAIKQECEALREVSGSVLSEQAPRLIFEGPWHTYYVQVQEQIVGHALRWPARVTSHHVDFLSKLLTIGRKSLPLSETVTWRRLKVFADSAASETLPQSIHFMLQRVFSSELAKRRVICHRTHGDFVAWNIRVSGTRLSAYDWESSLSDGLALTDLLHYLYGYASHVGLWPGERAMLGRMRKSAILLARRENLRADQYDLYVWIWLLGEYVAHPCKYIVDMSEVLACQAIP